tara:strand:- start:650 stop:808 length:159 start_codon:yes stop_codon:yes gene_type:complete
MKKATEPKTNKGLLPYPKKETKKEQLLEETVLQIQNPFFYHKIYKGKKNEEQ